MVFFGSTLIGHNLAQVLCQDKIKDYIEEEAYKGIADDLVFNSAPKVAVILLDSWS